MIRYLIGALVLLTAGCSAVDVNDNCDWQTPTVVMGVDGQAGIRARARCRGRMFGMIPVEGQIRCVATVALPGAVSPGAVD